ncbi:hypothetical protein Vqi01_51140 [Micromonospora qiuiae]|uniref:DUF397 domain-containing protein n=1 Tax=Micromonospora qiuiae TaxID=502268 RepID=A0ABQ4JK61_9ACTN|nr:hypothetical protein Vqi01_51140 [Micromonospora qiuiae]
MPVGQLSDHPYRDRLGELPWPRTVIDLANCGGKGPSGAALAFAPTAWRAFIAYVAERA